MSQEISLVAIVEAKPGHEAEMEAAIRPCVAATRKEAGCRLYTVHTEIGHPGRFVFIERWESQAALALHEQQPHFLTMAKAFELLLAGPLQMHILRELV